MPKNPGSINALAALKAVRHLDRWSIWFRIRFAMVLFKVQITSLIRDLLAWSLTQTAVLAKALKPTGPARLDICDLSIHVPIGRPMEWNSLAKVKRSIA